MCLCACVCMCMLIQPQFYDISARGDARRRKRLVLTTKVSFVKKSVIFPLFKFLLKILVHCSNGRCLLIMKYKLYENAEELFSSLCIVQKVKDCILEKTDSSWMIICTQEESSYFGMKVDLISKNAKPFKSGEKQ